MPVTSLMRRRVAIDAGLLACLVEVYLRLLDPQPANRFLFQSFPIKRNFTLISIFFSVIKLHSGIFARTRIEFWKKIGIFVKYRSADCGLGS